ncbi:MAG: hypothetical protein FWE96_07560, partial [Coriobacteriia bacterium]|nr:hypothetical protein [Coriobacteriia bacterium]
MVLGTARILVGAKGKKRDFLPMNGQGSRSLGFALQGENIMNSIRRILATVLLAVPLALAMLLGGGATGVLVTQAYAAEYEVTQWSTGSTGLLERVNNAEAGDVITISANIQIPAGTTLTIPANKDITLTSTNNSRLTGASGQSTITIVDTATLTLAGNLVITHTSGQQGRGVTVNSGGTFNIVGGEISGNTVTAHGGGVLSEGTLNMTDGVIRDNTADRGGGVLVVGSSSLFALSGTGAISSNTSTGVNGGGGISVENGASLEIKGGTIGGDSSDGNVAERGGGVYCTPGTVVNITGGRISGNTAAAWGGGYYGTGQLTLVAGSISNNFAGIGAGGVLNNAPGTFIISGGEVSRNTAPIGGGIAATVPAANGLTINGGIIEGNTATTGDGGAIWIVEPSTNLSTLTIAPGVIFKNNYAAGGSYNLATGADTLMYNTKIGTLGAGVIWTTPFTQGYNNHDISYVVGAPRTDLRTVIFNE